MTNFMSFFHLSAYEDKQHSHPETGEDTEQRTQQNDNRNIYNQRIIEKRYGNTHSKELNHQDDQECHRRNRKP